MQQKVHYALTFTLGERRQSNSVVELRMLTDWQTSQNTEICKSVPPPKKKKHQKVQEKQQARGRNWPTNTGELSGLVQSELREPLYETKKSSRPKYVTISSCHVNLKPPNNNHINCISTLPQKANWLDVANNVAFRSVSWAWHQNFCFNGDAEFVFVLSVSRWRWCPHSEQFLGNATINVRSGDSRTRASRLVTYRHVVSVTFLAPTTTKKKTSSLSWVKKPFFFSLLSQPELSQRERGRGGQRGKGYIKKTLQTTRDYAKENGRPQYQGERTSKFFGVTPESWKMKQQCGGER